MNKVFSSVARRWRLFYVPAVVLFTFSCTETPPGEEPWLTEVDIKASYTVDPEGSLEIEASGFTAGDRLVLDGNEYGAAGYHILNLSAFTSSGGTFGIPEEIQTGDYDLTALRSGVGGQVLGTRVRINVTENPEPQPWLTDIDLKPSYTVDPGGTLAIAAKGFAAGDKLLMDGSGHGGADYTLALSEATSSGASFTLPAALSSGYYDLSARRTGKTDMVLGTCRIEVSQPSPTIVGLVHCGGAPMEGVVVSDGYEVVKTGADGKYAIVSEKTCGFVFISIPSNYMPAQIAGSNQMGFFRRLTKNADTEETHDFELFAEPNGKHTMVMAADFHMAARTNDKTQLIAVFLPEMNSLIAANTAKGVSTYVMTLGDLTWDQYWTRGYMLNHFVADADMMSVQDSYNRSLPFFNCMGNHDNDPATLPGSTADWNGENAFRQNVCPVYYSFNIGDVHYIVIDDIMYRNSNNNRDYGIGFATHQMEWLEKDLAAIADKSKPVVVGTHANLLGVTGVANNGTGNAQYAVNPSNYSAFMGSFQGFADVTIFTGHSHKSFNIINPSYPHIIERNIPSVCATWWWTGYNLGDNKVQLCMNGAPGGVGIFDADGSDTRYRFQGFGLPADKQMRTYDRNTIHLTDESYDVEWTKSGTNYAVPFDTAHTGNQVIINVWNWGPGWTITVTENTAGGKVTLPATPTWIRDPYHIVCYNLWRLKAGSTPTSSFATVNRQNFFTVTASAPDTTLEIVVKDEYGNTYTETMTRPKKFPVTKAEIQAYFFK